VSCAEFRSYGEFSLELQRKLAGRRMPINGTVEVTWRCNLACAHCYNNLPLTDAAARRDELTFEEHCRILDQIAEAGCLWLLFTGGEVFVRPDFLDLYAYAKRKGFLVTIFTNGTMVTPRVADALAELPPFRIEITLYGRTRATYERVTGVAGSFDRCLRGIGLLRDRGISPNLKSVATSLNHHEIPAMREFVEAEVGGTFRFDCMLNARIGGSLNPVAWRMAPEEIVAHDLADPKRVEEWRRLLERRDGVPARGDGPVQLYGCGGGLQAFAIDPFGRLRVCGLSADQGYDLRSGSFATGWKTEIRAIRARIARRQTKCTACGLKELCGMCPAMGELEHGDPEKPVEAFCEVAHLRAMALGVEVRLHGECAYCAGGSQHERLTIAVARAREIAESLRWHRDPTDPPVAPVSR
jgi:radical SAM protein with 4Fe4S-binding SPASM domain